MLLTLGAPAAIAVPSIQSNRPYRMVPTWILIRFYNPKEPEPAPRGNYPMSAYSPTPIECELDQRCLSSSQLLAMLRRRLPIDHCFPRVWLAGEPIPVWAHVTVRSHLGNWNRFSATFAQDSAEPLRSPIFYEDPFFNDCFNTIGSMSHRLDPRPVGEEPLRMRIDWLTDRYQARAGDADLGSPEDEPYAQIIGRARLDLPLRVVASIDDAISGVDSPSLQRQLLDSIRVELEAWGSPDVSLDRIVLPDKCIAGIQIDLVRNDGTYCPIYASANTRVWRPYRRYMPAIDPVLMSRQIEYDELIIDNTHEWCLCIRSDPLGALALANDLDFEISQYWNGTMIVPLSAVSVIRLNGARWEAGGSTDMGPAPQ
jgi:hypothetical protein